MCDVTTLFCSPQGLSLSKTRNNRYMLYRSLFCLVYIRRTHVNTSKTSEQQMRDHKGWRLRFRSLLFHSANANLSSSLLEACHRMLIARAATGVYSFCCRSRCVICCYSWYEADWGARLSDRHGGSCMPLARKPISYSQRTLCCVATSDM